jgi:RNA polymerase sigma factor (sigma-70 family)
MPLPNDANEDVFEVLRPRLKAISYRIVANEAEAEDLVQDCFLKWHGVDKECVLTPAAWLTTVVQHLSIDRLRQRSRDARATENARGIDGDMQAPSPEELLTIASELASAFELLQQRLSAVERLALVLHDVFDCGHLDVAAALGITPANCRQVVFRARKRVLLEKKRGPTGEKLCRELIREFQAAIHHLDKRAIMTLLGDDAPVFVGTDDVRGGGEGAPEVRAMASQFVRIRQQIRDLYLPIAQCSAMHRASAATAMPL